MNARMFENEILAYFQNKLIEILNGSKDFDNPRIIASPRAVGDAVQEIVGENMVSCFPENMIKYYKASFPRRAMPDVAFSDLDDNYFVVDIKTHNIDTNFNRPNLTSVARLARFYENDKNFFVILLIEYTTKTGKLRFTNVRLVPIENFEWTCLTMGALGEGQIQIENTNIVNINRTLTRKQWMLQLCDTLDLFYPKEIEKIENRILRFQKVRKFWQNKK